MIGARAPHGVGCPWDTLLKHILRNANALVPQLFNMQKKSVVIQAKFGPHEHPSSNRPTHLRFRMSRLKSSTLCHISAFTPKPRDLNTSIALVEKSDIVSSARGKYSSASPVFSEEISYIPTSRAVNFAN